MNLIPLWVLVWLMSNFLLHHPSFVDMCPLRYLLINMLRLVLFVVPEADSVPVSVEGLEVLLIVDPLFASRTDGQASSSCDKRKKTVERHVRQRSENTTSYMNINKSSSDKM